MRTTLYVGNLPLATSASALRSEFNQCGEVCDVQIIADRETVGSRSYALVTMQLEACAKRAIEKFNGALFGGRELRVSSMEGRRTLQPDAATSRPQAEVAMRRPVEVSRPEPRPAAPARPAPAGRTPPRYEFEDSNERTPRRGKGVTEKPPVRIMQQFRERRNMTYELECSGVPLSVRIFFPTEDGSAAQWRVEVRTSDASAADAPTATATAASAAQALQHIAQSWHDAEMTRQPSKVDWDGVAKAMGAVRAL